MWGSNNNNNYSYPQQGQGQPGFNPMNNGGNQSKIPLNPGIALLGLVGKNTIQNNQQQWQQSPPNQNFNYPSMSNNSMGGGMNSMNNMNRGNGQNFGQNFGMGRSMPSHNQMNTGMQGSSYRNMNWSGYQLQSYMLNKMVLDQYIPTIFSRWDMDKNGTIEMHEFPGMICELFRCMNMPPPSQNDIWYLMWKFDSDRNGKIDYYEWANMVYTLGGLKSM